MAETLDLRRAAMQCGECKHRFGADAMFCPFDGMKLEPAAWDPTGDPLLGASMDGRYEVLGVLGEGGMGTVYQVRHITLDRLFAMKALRRDLASDRDLSARFMREARATARVEAPQRRGDHGLRLRIDGRAGGLMPDVAFPYFVMEHLAGQTLSDVIKRRRRCRRRWRADHQEGRRAPWGGPRRRRSSIAISKPDNFFVLARPRPEHGTTFGVVDFGAALILGASRVTKAGVVFGTPHYMSPEQASGQPVDHRADVYALGVIMYEMFAGRVPFIADTYMGVLTQHMFVKPVPPSRVARARVSWERSRTWSSVRSRRNPSIGSPRCKSSPRTSRA